MDHGVEQLPFYTFWFSLHRGGVLYHHPHMAFNSQHRLGMRGKVSPLPDTPPLQDVLHAAGHRSIAAYLQRIAGAHRQDEVMLPQSRLHASPCQDAAAERPML